MTIYILFSTFFITTERIETSSSSTTATSTAHDLYSDLTTSRLKKTAVNNVLLAAQDVNPYSEPPEEEEQDTRKR